MREVAMWWCMALAVGCMTVDRVERESAKLPQRRDRFMDAARRGPAAATDEVDLSVDATQPELLNVTIKNGTRTAIQYNIECSEFETWNGQEWRTVPILEGSNFEQICRSYGLSLRERTFVTHSIGIPGVLPPGTYRLAAWISRVDEPDEGFFHRERLLSNPFVLP
jgi:hypothetical protein